MLTLLLAYGAFLGAETLHVSGVVAVITAGLVVGNIWKPLITSVSSRQAVEAFWDFAAFAANSVIFLLLGNDVAHLHGFCGAGRSSCWPSPSRWSDVPWRSMAWRRSAIVCGPPIPFSWQHILCWGGLRGALSMALVLGLTAAVPRARAAHSARLQRGLLLVDRAGADHRPADPAAENPGWAASD